VGKEVGKLVVDNVGVSLETGVGDDDVGWNVGKFVGSIVGLDVGMEEVGTIDGKDDGFKVGWDDGLPGMTDSPGVGPRDGTNVLGGVEGTNLGPVASTCSFVGEGVGAIVGEVGSRSDCE
jgi:hypothetical protein